MVKIKFLKSTYNRYGEREHSFDVDGKIVTYCIPVGAKQSVDGLLRMLNEKYNGPDKEVLDYVSEGLGEF